MRSPRSPLVIKQATSSADEESDDSLPIREPQLTLPPRVPAATGVSMRLPFLSDRAAAPVRVPLPDVVQIQYGVYFCPVERSVPGLEEVTTLLTEWLQRHASEPLRSAIGEAVSRGLLHVETHATCAVPAPPADLFRYLGAGEEEIQRFQQASDMLLIDMPDRVGAPGIGLWGAAAAARAVAEAMDGVIFDPELPRLLPLATRTQPLPAGGKVEVTEQIIIPSSVDRRGLGWMTTKGMGKFGLPELELRDVPPSVAEMLTAVVNGMARHLIARTARLIGPDGPPRELVLEPEIRFGLVEMALDGAEGPAETPEGVRGWTMIRLQYNPGRRGSSSFLTLLPPRGFRGNHGIWLYTLLDDLFGGEDTLRTVEADSEAMEAAHMRAVHELPEARHRFQAGLQPGETLYVKHGFPTGAEGHEYMWLVVNTWSGDRLRAQIANDPQVRLDLRAGQEVELRESDIFDWMLTGRNGDREGGYTVAVVEREGQGGGE
jgi:uncharacterized protein YegJ (DUF2314 family)